jgi:hypothetical protein
LVRDYSNSCYKRKKAPGADVCDLDNKSTFVNNKSDVLNVFGATRPKGARMRVPIVFLGILVSIALVFFVHPVFAGGPPSVYNSPNAVFHVSGGGYLTNGAKVGFGAVAAGEKIEGHFHLVSNLSNGKASAVLLQIVDCQIEIIEVDCTDGTALLECGDGTIIEIISGDKFDPFNNGAVSVYTDAAGYLFGDTDPYAQINHGFVSAQCSREPLGPVYAGKP